MEETLLFQCEGAQLVGILHSPQNPARRGVLIVVGGPQYRVGSHRQFVLLARHLARSGIPVLRFDYRGMGDSGGASISFEDTGPDILAAIDVFFESVPELKDVVLWGLCDAASAAVLYAYQDKRIAGLVAVNPWVRTEESLARVHVRHYYGSRVFDRALWRDVLSGKVNVGSSLKDLLGILRSTAHGKLTSRPQKNDFTTGMVEGLEKFSGQILVIVSGQDLTASEFKDKIERSKRWRAAMDRESIEWRELTEANHTFSRQEWRSRVEDWTAQWVKSW